MKTKKVRGSERGQAIILMVLLITGLVAIAGLAVDGGRLYYSQRTAQNAADNAALAAAWAACSGGNVNNIAFASALTNGYDNDGSTNTMNVNRPPNSGPNVGDNEYIEVVINSVEEAGFSQLVFSGSLESTVRAVGRCSIATGPVGDGNAIIALNPSDKDGFKTNGNGSVVVAGGGIFVNSSHASQAMVLTGNATVTADSISVVGGYSGSGYSPTPSTGSSPITDPLAALDPPPLPSGSCSSASVSSGSLTIDPGLYCGISASGSGQLTMNAGVYYIEGGDFDISNSAIVVGNGILIYLDSGRFKMTGGDFNISAITSGDYAGMVIYLDRSNSNDLSITGNGNSTIQGTLYAAASEVKIAGNGANDVMQSQIIADTVKTSGNGAVSVEYDENQNFQFNNQTFIELSE